MPGIWPTVDRCLACPCGGCLSLAGTQISALMRSLRVERVPGRFRYRQREHRVRRQNEPFDSYEGTLSGTHRVFDHALTGKRSISVRECVGEGRKP